MSQVLIQQYLNQLQDLRKVSGTGRESVVREAFKDVGGLGLPARQPLRAGVDTRSVQGKDTQRPNHPRKVQRLPLQLPIAADLWLAENGK
jgi:hypothetical protein